MRTLIQKDLRENLKLALIGLLIFSLLLLSAYQSCITLLNDMLTGNGSGLTSELQPLLSQSLLSKAAFFCAIFGAALGWLQTRNEAHRDLWAFLAHRPITRTQIFWGKTIAGLVLYVFGAGLPLTILVAVVRTPGHVAAPFEWAMVLPLVSIFLTGVAYYFAGLLTGLRQARWYGSRSFGLAVAIADSLGVFTLPEFWQSLIAIAVAVVILATAAWGAYQTGGFYQGQPLIGRLASIVAVTTGCGVVLYFALELMSTLVFNPLSPTFYQNGSYSMTRDGAIYKTVDRSDEPAEIQDLNGHPLINPKTGQQMTGSEFSRFAAYGANATTSLKPQKKRNAIEDGSQFFTLCNVVDKTLWYIDRQGRLLGYDGRTRKYIGRTAATEPFLRKPNARYYSSYYDESRKLLATTRSVYDVDFKAHTMHPVFTVTNDDEIGGYADEGIEYNDVPLRYFFFTTRKTVYLLDSKNQPIFSVPYQPGYFEYPSVDNYVLVPTNSSMNSFAVWFFPDGELNRQSGWKMPTHVLWIGRDQSIARNATLPTLHIERRISPLEKLATALLSPVVALVKFNENIYNSRNALSFAAAVICTVIAGSRARRYNFSTGATIGWLLFVFLLGVTGLLALLCAMEWPARVTCPNCKKLRTVDRESCEHCQSAFSPPEKNGTEIFAPLAKA